MIMIKNKKKPIILDNPVINMFRYNIGIVAVLLIMCIIISFATNKISDCGKCCFGVAADIHQYIYRTRDDSYHHFRPY